MAQLLATWRAPKKAPAPAPIAQLPDEVLMDIMSRCDSDDFKHLRLVDKRWQRIASDPRAQRAAFMPALLAPLARLHQMNGTTEHLAKDHEERVAKRAAALFYRKQRPPCAATSWMSLAQQAHYTQDLAHTCLRADEKCQLFAASIWSGVMVVFLSGIMLSGVLCDQGTINDCPELVTLSVSLTLLSALFVLCSPVLWLVYNLLGLACEEVATYYKARLDSTLKGPCADIDALLTEALEKFDEAPAPAPQTP